MKKYILTKICIFSCLAPYSSEAVSLYESANIKVLKPISFIEEKKLNFGTIVTPGEEKVVEISMMGTVDASTTAQYLDTSSVSEASVKISGSNLNNINIVAEYLDNEPNIEVLRMMAQYDNVEGDLMGGLNNLISNSSGISLKFGAGIKIAANAVEGNYYPALKLSVNYE